MEWTQFAIFFIGVFGLWLWNRSESRSDSRHIEALIRSIQEEMRDFRSQWAAESKEFHGRLCQIEERKEEKSKLILEELIKRGK